MARVPPADEPRLPAADSPDPDAAPEPADGAAPASPERAGHDEALADDAGAAVTAPPPSDATLTADQPAATWPATSGVDGGATTSTWDPTGAPEAEQDDEPTPPRPRRPRPVPEAMAGEDADEPTALRLRRRLLGNGTLLLDATRKDRIVGWAWALAVTAFAGVIRFWDLARPHALVFDETYYVKQAYSLLRFGYEGGWGDDPNPGFESGDTSMLTTAAEYVVHPPVGKWMIALGIHFGGGVTSSFAWRLSAAVCGTLAVLMIARIGRRLFASTALGTLAGLFLAVDGMAIVLSRTSLLDPFLMFFVLAAFGALLLDREQARRRLADRVAAVVDTGGTLGWGPGLGFRWWRLAAAVLLGLACGTKWSGIYFLAVFGAMSVAWDVAARRTVGVRPWLASGVLRDGVPAGLIVVGTTFVTYLASWTGWLVTDGGWDRQWAANNPGEGVQWLPPALRSLWHFHNEMWHFHNTLTSPHAYAAHPIGWIIQWRPTSFFYPTSISGLSGADAQAACGAASCSQPITSLGNPLVWWLGSAAFLVAIGWFVRYRDWRAFAALSGILAGWLPWFAYAHRTIFTFYAIAFAPWVVLTLVYVMGLVIGPPGEDPKGRKRAIVVVAAISALIVAVGAFFYPVWTAQVIPYYQWHLRMWLPSWV